jgi:vaccinia related kinase
MIVNDEMNQKWCIKNKIAQGGFGIIYSAFSERNDPADQPKVVAKIQPAEESHLEIEETVYKSLATSKLSKYYIPVLYASGIGMNRYKEHFRCIIIEQLDTDLYAFLKQNRRCEDVITTQLISGLQFIHDHGYSHGDLKVHNVLVNLNNGVPIFKLADLGLAQSFVDEKNDHLPYQINKMQLHRGTLPFISEDSHMGVIPSRRSDLENLGWMLILSIFDIALPWYLNEKSYEQRNKNKVLEEKQKFKQNIDDGCGPLAYSIPHKLKIFMKQVFALDYSEKPDYDKLWSVTNYDDK